MELEDFGAEAGCAKEVRKRGPTDNTGTDERPGAVDHGATGEGRQRMKYVLIAVAVMVLLVPASALAAGNPEAKLFITFTTPTPDNASVVNTVYPAAYTAVTAYLGATDLGMGMQGISFMITDVGVDCPGVFAPDPGFTNLLPGDLAIGNYLTGITLASTDCMNVDGDAGREYIDPVIFASISLFYLGGECDVMILDHPEYPRWILDCDDPAGVDFYCIWTHGGVNKAALPGDAECDASTPVEAQTWGAIKALYR